MSVAWRTGTARRTVSVRTIRILGASGVALLLAVSTALAQTAYRLDRASVDAAGGGVAESANYALLVSLGQHDAGQTSNSQTYAYAGGVFAQIPGDMLFRDGFEGE